MKSTSKSGVVLHTTHGDGLMVEESCSGEDRVVRDRIRTQEVKLLSEQSCFGDIGTRHDTPAEAAVGSEPHLPLRYCREPGKGLHLPSPREVMGLMAVETRGSDQKESHSPNVKRVMFARIMSRRRSH